MLLAVVCSYVKELGPTSLPCALGSERFRSPRKTMDVQWYWQMVGPNMIHQVTWSWWCFCNANLYSIYIGCYLHYNSWIVNNLGKGDDDCAQQHPCAGTAALDEASMPFADSLLASLGRGAQSCAQLQESAMAMVLESEGHCSNVTKALSKIGCSGKFPGNCERDLFNILSLPVDPWES